jgi:acetolactate synthase-1/2/3 large subunit
MATCGEVLAQLLEAYGIDTVFGIPGVHTVELYRGLPATRIRHVTPRHEQGAGFMADGYARVSGRPAACFIITGPGMTNILTAMGQAYADSVPMLVISSVNRTAHLGMGQGRLHELPSQRQMAAGVTAFSHTLLHEDQLPEVLARAFAVFASARPRPVHIEIPIDVITRPADHLPVRAAPLPGRPARLRTRSREPRSCCARPRHRSCCWVAVPWRQGPRRGGSSSSSVGRSSARSMRAACSRPGIR